MTRCTITAEIAGQDGSRLVELLLNRGDDPKAICSAL